MNINGQLIEQDESQLYWKVPHANAERNHKGLQSFGLASSEAGKESETVATFYASLEEAIKGKSQDGSSFILEVMQEPTLIHYPGGVHEVRCIFGFVNVA